MQLTTWICLQISIFPTEIVSPCIAGPYRFSSCCRVVSQAGLNIRADAAELSAKTTAATTPPTDLTQAIAVAGFLLVRFGKGSFDVDPGLILKSLASLQLLVAAVALLTRGVHSDRVSFPGIKKHPCLQQPCWELYKLHSKHSSTSHYSPLVKAI